MHKEKALIYKLSRSKAPKHSKFRLTDMQEKPRRLYSRNNFANLSFFAIVSVPVQSIIRQKCTLHNNFSSILSYIMNYCNWK